MKIWVRKALSSIHKFCEKQKRWSVHLCRQRGLRNSSHVWRGKLLLAPNVGFLTRGADQLSNNISLTRLTIDSIQPYWRYNSVVEFTCHGVTPIDMSSSYTLHPTSQSYMSEIFILMQCRMILQGLLLSYYAVLFFDVCCGQNPCSITWLLDDNRHYCCCETLRRFEWPQGALGLRQCAPHLQQQCKHL